MLAELPGDGHVLVQADLGDADAVGRMVDEVVHHGRWVVPGASAAASG